VHHALAILTALPTYFWLEIRLISLHENFSKYIASNFLSQTEVKLLRFIDDWRLDIEKTNN
jgi:hypothetical protein